MSTWLIVLLVVGYLVVGSVAARVTAWLAKERFIFVPSYDIELTLVLVLFMWPLVVPGWVLVHIVRFLAFPRRLR